MSQVNSLSPSHLTNPTLIETSRSFYILEFLRRAFLRLPRGFKGKLRGNYFEGELGPLSAVLSSLSRGPKENLRALLELNEEWLEGYRRRLSTLSDYLWITVVVTDDCTMSCPYCFVRRRSGHMSSKVLHKVLELIEARADLTPPLDRIRVEWFGGEPLLRLDDILGFARVLDGKGYNYRMSVLTNGVLLTPEVALELAKLHTDRVQVTLDGYGEHHDITRNLNGKPSFDIIVENLKGISRISDRLEGMRVIVRVNLTSYNIDDIPLLMELVRKLGPMFTLAPRAVHNLPQRTPSPLSPDRMRWLKAVAEAVLPQVGEGFRKGLTALLSGLIPEGKSFYCEAADPNTVIINPDGRVTKCTTLIGHDELKGLKALDVIGELGELVDRLREGDPSPMFRAFWGELDERCLSCPILRWCMSGCRLNRYLGGLRCMITLEELKEILVWFEEEVWGGELPDEPVFGSF